MPPPLVLGHEGAGTVVEVGEGVTDLAVGDPSCSSFVDMCGKCRYCVTGRPALCDSRRQGAVTLPDGTPAHQGQGRQAAQHLLRLRRDGRVRDAARRQRGQDRPEIPLDEAALVGCAVMTGVGAAFNTARVEPGSTVVVFGAAASA